jgi:hypothetical protein
VRAIAVWDVSHLVAHATRLDLAVAAAALFAGLVLGLRIFRRDIRKAVEERRKGWAAREQRTLASRCKNALATVRPDTTRKMFIASLFAASPLWLFWDEPITDASYPFRGLTAWTHVAAALVVILPFTVALSNERTISRRRLTVIGLSVPLACGTIGLALVVRHRDQRLAAKAFAAIVKPYAPGDILPFPRIRGHSGRVYSVCAVDFHDSPGPPPRLVAVGTTCAVVNLDAGTISNITYHPL